MTHLMLKSGIAAVLAAAALIPAQAQTPKSSKSWVLPHTPDGQPDLQGIWTNPTITPFERPERFGNRATLTEQEAADMEKQAAQNAVDRPARPGEVGDYNRAWFDSGTKVVGTRATSLVVEPEDGRVPLTSAALEKHAWQQAHTADYWEAMSVWDRCITRGVPGGMFPAGYNNAYQIVQTPGYVMILYEMIHEAHIIPLSTPANPLQHVPASVKQLNGDPIGHWEGNTLVVDITGFNSHSQIATSAATGRIRAMPETENLHVVERFTRTDENTIMYEARIEDPPMYSKPWKVQVPLSQDANYKVYEYACQEGNEAVALSLKGGRAQEAAAFAK
jgi:hypothetical protein